MEFTNANKMGGMEYVQFKNRYVIGLMGGLDFTLYKWSVYGNTYLAK